MQSTGSKKLANKMVLFMVKSTAGKMPTWKIIKSCSAKQKVDRDKAVD